MKFFNDPKFLDLRKELRNNPTSAEKVLWNELKNRSFLNLKFRRQEGIGNYIVDFYCRKIKIVIELDGDVYNLEGAKEKDKVREDFLISKKLKVIRFTNEDILNNLNKVLEELEKAIKTY